MRLGKLTSKFLAEDGAVSTDWVVITAFVVGMAYAIGSLVGGLSQDYGDVVADTMSARGIVEY